MRVHLHGAARAFPTGVERTEHCCAEQQCVRTEASHVKGDLFFGLNKTFVEKKRTKRSLVGKKNKKNTIWKNWEKRKKEDEDGEDDEKKGSVYGCVEKDD